MTYFQQSSTKRRLIALGLALSCIGITTLPAAQPAQAQWAVTDPIVEIQSTLGASKMITEVSQQATQLQHELTEIKQLTSQLADADAQVKQMISDHIALPSGLQTSINTNLLSNITKNINLMNTTSSSDSTMTAEFSRLVPSFKAGQDYLSYINQLNANVKSALNQGLGLADQSVQDSSKVSQALLSTPAGTNQLQLTQQLVQIGTVQSQQMDKLIKIQAAMLKSMAVTYQAARANGEMGGTGGVNINGIDDGTAMSNCIAGNPALAFVDSATRATEVLGCKQQLLNSQNQQQQLQYGP